MTEQNLIDGELARVLEILEQVKELNKMIGLHQNQSKDSFMISQYEDMKSRFLEDLKEILHHYEIEVTIKDKAA
ncbi:MAG: hypothetical protein ACKV1O_24995 [Saprospiraceae bacterium]